MTYQWKLSGGRKDESQEGKNSKEVLYQEVEAGLHWSKTKHRETSLEIINSERPNAYR